MTIRSFDLLRPRTLPEAIELLSKHGDDARLIAGGTTIVILMKQRAVHFPYLVDLQSISGLDQITGDAEGVRIGALATHRSVERSPLVRSSYPALAQACGAVGNVRVRETASIGGNLAHADYRLDPPPPLLVFGAEVSLFGPAGARVIPLKDFFRGMYETALGLSEILVDIKIPPPPPDSRAVYLRYSALAANDWPCLGVAALLSMEGGRCKELRLAFSGLAQTPLVIAGLEFVRGERLEAAVLDKVLDVIDGQITPFSDLRGSEWYKRRVARVFTKRAIAELQDKSGA